MGLGVVAGRLWLRPGQQRQLEERLHAAQQAMQTYQHEVAKHFVETSSRISDLTLCYKELHEHLARGAANLASPDISRTLLDAATHKLDSKPVILDESSLEPPRDWAPKNPGARGTLSEDYGLHDADESRPVYPTDTLIKPR